MPTSTIIGLLLPLLFQSISAAICPADQTTSTNMYGQPVNVCFQLTASPVAPGEYDAESIDRIANTWMIDTWTNSSTRISQLRSIDGSCTQWNSVEDEMNQSSTTCEEILN